MKHYKFDDGHCPCGVTSALQVIGAKWKIIIIVTLGRGVNRFNDLKKNIENINDRALSLKLKELEEDGLVVRTVTDGCPPKVEYSLTDKGQDLTPVIKAVHKWADTYLVCDPETEDCVEDCCD
jgi:DNA-binding HxlR family transcriptional regulator